MGIQVIPRKGDLPISAARDLRYCYPQALRIAVENFNERKWPELMSLAEDLGVEFADLCEAMESYQRFLVNSCQHPEENMHQSMVRAGWFEHSTMAQTAIMAMLGVVVSGQLFYSIRETTEAGKDIDPELRTMIEASQEAIDAARRRPWRARLRLRLRLTGRHWERFRRGFIRWRRERGI